MKLKNAPLAECIVEVRWKLEDQGNGLKADPNYKILMGRFYDRIIKEYPYHEPLPSSTMPDELVGYVVQHRFRIFKDGWPLVQLGPGIITLNETTGYSWEELKVKLERMISIFFESYPDIEKLHFESILIRYINAIKFDFKKDDIFIFLKEKMHFNVEVPGSLFEYDGINVIPDAINLSSDYKTKKPQGIVNIQFVNGKSKNVDSLVWNIMLRSDGEINTVKEEVTTWFDEAHSLAEHCFYKLCEGELLRRFE